VLAEIAQLVEHATENRSVVSSILSLGTTRQKLAGDCGRSTAVVRLLAKEKVVGSNPIARSRFPVNGWHDGSWRAISCQPNVIYLATSPSGKARVCKTLIMGSNPIVASKKKIGILPVFFSILRAIRQIRPVNLF
jgi:hypothetical protein